MHSAPLSGARSLDAPLEPADAAHQKLPTELLIPITDHADVETCRALALVNKACLAAARPRLWRDVTVDTGQTTLAKMTELLMNPMWSRVSAHIKHLDVYLGPLAASCELDSPLRYLSLVAAMKSLLVRLPHLDELRLDIGEGAEEDARSILFSLDFMQATLAHLSLDFYGEYLPSHHVALFHGVRRHRRRLRSVNLYVDWTATVDLADVELLSDLTSLTIGNLEFPSRCFASLAPFRFDTMHSLDVGSCLEFKGLCSIFLPLVPNLLRLEFYLVFPPDTEASLPSLPALTRLHTLTVRSVYAAEMADCLRYFAPLPSLSQLTISAVTEDLVEVADAVAAELMEGDNNPRSPTLRSLPALRHIALEWEGDGALGAGTEEHTALEEALNRLRPRMQTRGVDAVAMGMDTRLS